MDWWELYTLSPLPFYTVPTPVYPFSIYHTPCKMTFHKQQGSLHSRHTNKRSTRHDKRDKSRQQAEKERALHPYTLRSRTNSRSSAPTEGHSAMGSHKKGRFKSWQTKVLEDVLQAGIWHPGDATVALLVEGLKDR